MPSNKIYTILIICIGIIASIWLIQRNPTDISAIKQNVDGVSVSTYTNTEKVNTDWKKILVSVDPKSSVITDLTKNNSGNNDDFFDETTLTGQMSKDFLSQYLLLKKGGKTLTEEDVDQITNNVTSSPVYSGIKGPVYVPSNLYITSNASKNTVSKYRDKVNLVLKTRSTQINDNLVTIVNNALKSGNSGELSRLDPIIEASKGFISDFLNMEVPNDAVGVHLDLLNSVSKFEADMEAMKQIYNDPIRAISGISQYNIDIIDFQNALNKINNYFDQKL